MRRLVANADIMTSVYAPADFDAQAERAMAVLPDEWEAVVTSPAVVPTENGGGLEYLGAMFTFYQVSGPGSLKAGFVVPSPDALLDERMRSEYLDRLRYAFEHPAKHAQMPEPEYRIGS